MNQQVSMYHYIVLMLATLLWGINVVSLKILVTAFDPVAMTSFRIMTAGLFLIGMLIFAKSSKHLTRREWGYILAGGGLGVFAHHLFLSIGLTTVPASTGGLILGLVPVMTAIASSVFLKESFSIWKIIGIVLAFVGLLVVQGGFGSITSGVVYLLIAVVVQAVSFVFIQKASVTISTLQITAYTLIVGSILLFFVSLSIEPQGVASMDSGNAFLYSVFLFSAIGATACGQMMFNMSIRRVGSSKSALFLNFVPFFGLLCSSLFLNEPIYWYHWCGFVFIVSGVLFGTGYVEKTWLKSRQREKKTA